MMIMPRIQCSHGGIANIVRFDQALSLCRGYCRGLFTDFEKMLDQNIFLFFDFDVECEMSTHILLQHLNLYHAALQEFSDRYHDSY